MRWWGWLLLTIGLLVCAAAGTWFTWGYVGQRRLDALIAEIRSRGEPVEWKDFAEAPGPAEQDALPLYWEAHDKFLVPKGPGTSYDVGTLEDMLRDLTANEAYRKQHRGEVGVILELSRDSLALATQAAARTGANYNIDFRRPAIQAELPVLARVLTFADAIVLAALEAHDAGQDAQALRHLQVLFAMSRTLGRHPMLIVQFVSVACAKRAAMGIEQIESTLQVGPEPAATSAQVRALIDEFLDTDPARRGWVRAMMAERSFAYDTIERVRRGEFSLQDIRSSDFAVPRNERPGWAKVLWPLLTWDELTCLQVETSMVECARQTDYPAARRALGDGPDSYQSLRLRSTQPGFAIWHPFTGILIPTSCEAVPFHHLALRRMAATALAMRSYNVEKGRPVAALADLVTAGFLKELPADPFSDKGEPIRYKADPEQPLLYSVGKDGRDDGGTFKLDADGGVDKDSPDIVFFLKGDRPARKPTWEPPTPTTREGK